VIQGSQNASKTAQNPVFNIKFLKFSKEFQKFENRPTQDFVLETIRRTSEAHISHSTGVEKVGQISKLPFCAF